MKNDRTTAPRYDSQSGRAVILMLYALGWPMHRIAPLFDENQGRIAEVIATHNAAFAPETGNSVARLRATESD